MEENISPGLRHSQKVGGQLCQDQRGSHDTTEVNDGWGNQEEYYDDWGNQWDHGSYGNIDAIGKGFKGKGLREKAKASIKGKAKASQWDSRDNVTHVVSMDIQRGSVLMAMGNPGAKERIRQSAKIAAIRGTSQPIAPKEKERARQ